MEDKTEEYWSRSDDGTQNAWNKTWKTTATKVARKNSILRTSLWLQQWTTRMRCCTSSLGDKLALVKRWGRRMNNYVSINKWEKHPPSRSSHQGWWESRRRGKRRMRNEEEWGWYKDENEVEVEDYDDSGVSCHALNSCTFRNFHLIQGSFRIHHQRPLL